MTRHRFPVSIRAGRLLVLLDTLGGDPRAWMPQGAVHLPKVLAREDRLQPWSSWPLSFASRVTGTQDPPAPASSDFNGGVQRGLADVWLSHLPII